MRWISLPGMGGTPPPMYMDGVVVVVFVLVIDVDLCFGILCDLVHMAELVSLWDLIHCYEKRFEN